MKHRQGFLFANLGGFETEGTYNFLKWTFRPVEELKQTHLVLDKSTLYHHAYEQFTLA